MSRENEQAGTFSLACSSVNPTMAISGCVKQAAGMARWSTALGLPQMFSTALHDRVSSKPYHTNESSTGKSKTACGQGDDRNTIHGVATTRSAGAEWKLDGFRYGGRQREGRLKTKGQTRGGRRKRTKRKKRRTRREKQEEECTKESRNHGK